MGFQRNVVESQDSRSWDGIGRSWDEGKKKRKVRRCLLVGESRSDRDGDGCFGVGVDDGTWVQGGRLIGAWGCGARAGWGLARGEFGMADRASI